MPSPQPRVALITGGASGMGLAVATLLSKHPLPTKWHIHILDLKTSPGVSAIGATFHESNVTDYASLRRIFQRVVDEKGGRGIDFVFANAGVAEHANFFAAEEEEGGPRGMDGLVDINLKGVINTAYLALHYMCCKPAGIANGDEEEEEEEEEEEDRDRDRDKSLIITASCGALYPSYYSPIYTSTKHAVLGFMRSIAPHFYHRAGIRVNAICPGVVKTNLLSQAEWANFPDEYFTPVAKIGEVVGMLVEGVDGEEGREEGVLNGKAVEISGTKHYYRDPVAYCDEGMEKVMGATNVEVLEGAGGS